MLVIDRFVAAQAASSICWWQVTGEYYCEESCQYKEEEAGRGWADAFRPCGYDKGREVEVGCVGDFAMYHIYVSSVLYNV